MNAPEVQDSDAGAIVARAGWCLAGVLLMSWAWTLVASADSIPLLAVVAMVVTAVGLVVIAVSWTSPTGFPNVAVAWITAIVWAGAFCVWAWVQFRTGPGYGTDELAFDQYAAQLFAHFHNPYQHSMAPALDIFNVSRPPTFKLDGSEVTSLSYPDLSFLMYVPFVLLGWTTQLANYINAAAWAVSVVLAFLLLPRAAKPLAIVFGSSLIYTSLVVGGVSDALYLPFLILAVYRWDRFPQLSGWRAWVSPVALGFAMSVKQTPWLVLLFVALGLFLDADRRVGRHAGVRTALTYVGLAVLAFVVVNLPFLAVDPVAWARGTLSPLSSGLIPGGQGWVALSTYLGIGGGTLLAYAALLASALICATVLFVVAYPRTKLLVVLMPAFVLVFSSRSLVSYLVMLALPAVVAACSVEVPWSDAASARAALFGSLRRRVAVFGSLALVGASLLAAVLWPPPLQLSITAVYSSGDKFAINRVAIRATNGSGETVHPVFAAKAGGELTEPWLIISGPATLGAGRAATFLIQAPNVRAEQPGSGGFRIVALTTSPAAMSVSSPYLPVTFGLTISPATVDAPVPPGMPITFTVRVVDRIGRTVLHAGTPVYLQQTSYALEGQGPRPVVHVIGAGRVGRVMQVTDSQGVARFVVVGTVSSLQPIYFRAYLLSKELHVPYGASGIVSVVFAGAPRSS